MQDYIVSYNVAHYNGADFLYSESFCKLAVRAKSTKDAHNQALALQPNVVAAHIESTEDPEIDEDSVIEIHLDTVEHTLYLLQMRRQEMENWKPEQQEDEDE